MMLVPGMPGVAFGAAADGDGRSDARAREAIASQLGIPASWGIVDQVHGATVLSVTVGGHAGEADALITSTPFVPLAIGTADCVPVAMTSESHVAIVHAGWRGVAAGIVANTVSAFGDGGVASVAIGPHIGPCCYEVGSEVVSAIGGHEARTSWGTRSVDLASAIRAQIPVDVAVVDVEQCTMCSEGYSSFRRDGTANRQVSVVWQ